MWLSEMNVLKISSMVAMPIGMGTDVRAVVEAVSARHLAVETRV